MAESKPYRLPNTEGQYVTVPLTNQTGEIYRLNQDGTRTLFASYGLENRNLVLVSEPESSQEFQRNLAQNSQGYNRTISNSILDANNQTNSQPDPNQPGSPGGSTPTNPNTPDENETNNKPKVQRLTYPIDISDNQDKIKFEAYTYTANRLFSPGPNPIFDLKPVTFNSVGSAVFLAIQSQILDQNSVDWGGGETLNPLEVAAANLSSNLMKAGTTKNLTSIVEKNFKSIVELAQSSSGEIKTYLVGQAIGVNNLLSRSQGKVVNPNLELLFQGPQLRPFSFTFKLSPRSGDEATNVKDIIKYFKKNMAVIKDNNIFLKAPNVFKIQYQYGAEKPHPGLNLIKMCALTNCSVDYTPLGTYMTYPDGTMVSYTLSLQFQELTPVYQDDYDTFNYGDGTKVPNPTIGA